MEAIKDLLVKQVQNQVQVQTEPRNLEIGEQVDFEIALSNDKIVNTSTERLKQVLRLVMMKIGLRAANLPSDEEKFVLVQHIIQHYGGHTPEEILLAFDMAIAGKLEVEVNCYENFSCLYVSNIMNAYRAWAKDQHKQIKPIMMIEKTSPLTDESIEEWLKSIKTEARVDFMPVMVYDWLEKVGRIKYTTQEKFDALQVAAKYRRQQLIELNDLKEYTPFMAMYETGLFEGKILDYLKTLAKKFLLTKYLREND